MLELFYNIYSLDSGINSGDYSAYVYGNNGEYYYGFIDSNSNEYTVGITHSNSFREKISCTFNLDSYKPFKNNDIIFLSTNGDKAFGCIKRGKIRSVYEFELLPFDKNGLKFFNMLEY